METAKTTKFIFLDIDGVMVPSRSYFKLETNKFIEENGDTIDLVKYDPLAVNMINRICTKSGAKIVFNTTWNMYKSMETIAQTNGIDPQNIFYGAPKTEYPNKGLSRLAAINKFLMDNQNPLLDPEPWVAFDDEFIDHKNAIQVDYENGLTVENYRQAMDILGCPDKFICLI